MDNIHLVNLPKTSENVKFIKQLRQKLKNTPLAIRIRGRGARKHLVAKGYSSSALKYSIPLGVSTSLSLYLVEKPKTRTVVEVVTTMEPQTVMVPVTRKKYSTVPTKWA